MLITCTECGGTVSDKAYACPHCGFPMKDTPVRNRKSNKKMKLPNGFGGISFLKGNYRKPYRAMVTVGHREDGRPITKILKPQGYFETYNEAYQALIEYHRDPYDVSKDATFKEVYNEWIKIKEKSVTKGGLTLYDQGFKCLSGIHDMKMRDIKPKVIRAEIEKYRHLVRGPKNMKTVLNFVFDYAVENEIVEKNYARDTKISVDVNSDSHHISFSDDEIKTLWQHKDNETVKMMLIQCYSGMRPGELVDLKLANIHLNENLIIGGSKTKAGINRRIPIHPEVKEFVEHFWKIASGKNNEYLFCNSKSAKVRIEKYRIAYKKIISQYKLNPEHKAHDPRKFFVTQAKKYQLDEYAIKLIVGHAIEDLTEKVYTERSFDWLYSEICKIPGCEDNV